MRRRSDVVDSQFARSGFTANSFPWAYNGALLGQRLKLSIT
jgi:hypothetical protein